ncbi:MAG: phosphatidate cytidylyltransferase [Planctomycetes bacterium]|nr:phosphatidate cytidylyltransferase [Planctomycetota bacterium]
MKARLILGTGLSLAVVGILLADRWLGTDAGFTFLVLSMCVVAWREYAAIALPVKMPGMTIAGGALSVLFLAAVWLDHHPHGSWTSDADTVLLPGLLIASLGGFLFAGVAAKDYRRAHAAAIAAFAGVIWLGYLPGFFLRLRYIGGSFWPILLIVSIKMNDTFAYFAGRAIGRTPLARVSPKKTVEGAIAGLLGGTAIFAAGALAAAPVGFPGRSFSWPGAVASGMIIGVVAQAGDLAESLVKRAAEVKDSGRGIPGLGGALDILDSLLFACPVGYFLIRWAP